MPRQKLERSLDRLMSRRLAQTLANCGNESAPGTDESAKNRDWSKRPTTRDQLRIEQFLAQKVTPSSKILHIGIGNSSFAQKFSGLVGAITGITISSAECDFAKTLGLSNYTPLLVNKYSKAYAALPGQFDFIIDNNPTTFACCRAHFWRMMQANRDKLAPGGRIFTDKIGLAHLASDAPVMAPWQFTPQDWLAMADALGLKAQRHGVCVLSMSQE